MKKALLIIVFLLILTACAPGSTPIMNLATVEKQFDLLNIHVPVKNTVTMEIPYTYGIYDVVRFEDPENGNLCYILADYASVGAISGMSCVKGE